MFSLSRWKVRSVLSLSCLLAGAALPHVAAAQSCESWVNVATDGPEARRESASVFDGRRVILLGGSTGGDPFPETWSWDGTAWTILASTGPVPRNFPAMTYDTDRDRVVVFGGFLAGSGAVGDTWEWNGDTQEWIQHDPIHSPSPRGGAVIFYDTLLQMVILFGGAGPDQIALSDTWAWDGTDWFEMPVSGPSPRVNAAGAYDSNTQEGVLFGGVFNDPPFSQQTTFDDTWVWDSSLPGWTQVFPGSSPAARGSSAMCFRSNAGDSVLLGGSDLSGQEFDDTWSWNASTDTWSQKPLNPHPSARHSLTMANDGLRNVAVVFGGIRSPEEHFGDTWELEDVGPNLEVDASCPSGGPITVSWSGATPSGNVALIFALNQGGFVVPFGYPCQGVQLDLGSNQIQVVYNGPSDANGAGTKRSSAGSGACGGYLQLLDLSTCCSSDAVRIE